MITKILDENTISFIPEESDDLLILRRIIKKNNKIVGETTRVIKQDKDFSRPDKGERIKIRLAISVEKISLDKYSEIYSDLDKQGSIASILSYSPENLKERRDVVVQKKDFVNSNGIIGVIGAGNFTRSMVLPALKKINANIKYIASSGGLSATDLARKYGIEVATSNMKIIFDAI